MNIQTETCEEYFAKADEREAALRAVDSLVREAAPNLEQVLFNGMGSGVVLGYGMPLSDQEHETVRRMLVVLAKQNNYISLYSCAIDKDGQ